MVETGLHGVNLPRGAGVVHPDGRLLTYFHSADAALLRQIEQAIHGDRGEDARREPVKHRDIIYLFQVAQRGSRAEIDEYDGLFSVFFEGCQCRDVMSGLFFQLHVFQSLVAGERRQLVLGAGRENNQKHTCR